MPITYTDNGGGAANGSDLEFTFTFPVLQTEDVKVALNGVTQATTKYAVDTASNPTKITFNNTSIDSSVQESTGAPKSGVRVRVYRETTVGKSTGDDDPKAVYAAGSSIRATDLNANTEQALYAIHELQTRPIETEDIQDSAITSSKIEDGTIVNADINASAAIDGTKISPNFGSQNIVTSGTVDGRDVSTDGTKLDGIESGATADQTAAEIRTLVGNATDSNVFTDAEKTKLSGIEASATADQTAAEIRTLVGNATDSNVFTDAEKTKLNGIESGATADQTGAEIKAAYEGESNTNAFTDAEKTKLSNLGSLNALSDVNTSGVADGKILKYDASASKFVIADDGGGGGGGGSSTFTGLSDTPANFGSAAGKTLKVNSAGNAVEFVTVTTPAGNFAGLTDTPSSLTGQGGKTVKVNSGGTALEFETVTTDVVDDTTPQLGGNLDVQTNEITTSTTNGNVKLTPNGTGTVEVKGAGGNDGTLQLNCSQNSHGVKVKSPAHSASASYTLTLPTNIQNGGRLKTDTNGVLSWDTNTYIQANQQIIGSSILFGASQNVVFDTDNSNTYNISFVGPSTLTKNSAFTLPEDGSNGQFLKTNGSGVLSFADVTSTYNIQINTLSSSSGTGGGSATFNGSATRFTLSNPGTNAQAHLVSVNGVIQKPNSGTSPSEGFAIDGNDIIFASAPASGSDFFILTLGNAISIGTPSDNTVTSAKIVDGTIVNADINASAAIAGSKLADDSVTEAKLDIHAAPSGTDKVLGYTSNGMEWVESAAGATGGGTDKIFWENGQTVTTNYTITNGYNAMSAGPVTINNGIAVTIGTGENWTIV
jgi:hypothetical protein